MIDRVKLMTQAAMLRKELGEDESSPIDVFALAQQLNGLTIVYYPLGEKLSGMCVKGQGDNTVIAINSTMTMGRQRFTLAHELFHLKYDDSMVSVCAKRIDTENGVERSANMFASYFLMPNAALMDFVQKLVKNRKGGKLTLEDVIRIEQYFGVSHQAAVFRLMKTPYLTESMGNNFLMEAVRYEAEKLGYKSDLYRPLPEDKQYRTYGYYINQVNQLLSKGMISDGKYEELLLDAFRPDLVYGSVDEESDVID